MPAELPYLDYKYISDILDKSMGEYTIDHTTHSNVPLFQISFTPFPIDTIIDPPRVNPPLTPALPPACTSGGRSRLPASGKQPPLCSRVWGVEGSNWPVVKGSLSDTNIDNTRSN